MNISLEQVSKKFQQHWIFREINYQFIKGNSYALLGANGSGKSTLLRIVAGMQTPSRGKVVYTNDSGNTMPAAAIYEHISFCAPGQEIVEELTLQEFFEFHFSFKRPLSGLNIQDIIALTGLKNAIGKPIGDYSSGMKQRVKLAQAIFTDTPVLFLDEPCTNLDLAGVEQYRSWMEQYGKDRLIFVASNDVREYFFCGEQIAVEDYK